MKINKFRRSMLCAMLCLSMLLAAFLVSCNNDAPETPTDTTKTEEKVEVVRLAADIKYGTKVTSSKIEVVSVNKADLPAGTILSKDDVLGKFTTTAMYAGEYFNPKKLADTRPGNVDDDGNEIVVDEKVNFENAGYVIVSDFVKADTGADVYEDIQKLIDKHPNKTIYFPDGVYLISKPIETSADPAKTVSLKLSNYAHFRPTEDWVKGEPLFKLGAKDMADGIVNEGNHYSLEGGILDGANTADAVWVMNAGDVSLRYISIKSAVVGIHVKGDEEGNGPTVDVHTVNITGSGTLDSIGVVLDSNSNTLTNMRIARNQIAIKLTSNDNFLRNLHPLYIFDGKLNPATTYKDSVAFYDGGKRNFYDNCYNDQFATGFYMVRGNESVFDCCFSFWYNKNYGIHNSFVCEGQFNGTIRFTSTDTSHASQGTVCNFLLVGEKGGKGVIDTIFCNPGNLSSDDVTKDYLINNMIY